MTKHEVEYWSRAFDQTIDEFSARYWTIKTLQDAIEYLNYGVEGAISSQACVELSMAITSILAEPVEEPSEVWFEN